MGPTSQLALRLAVYDTEALQQERLAFWFAADLQYMGGR
jgi:hypothetical protein